MRKENHLVRKQAQLINELEKKVAHYEKLLNVYSRQRETRFKLLNFFGDYES